MPEPTRVAMRFRLSRARSSASNPMAEPASWTSLERQPGWDQRLAEILEQQTEINFDTTESEVVAMVSLPGSQLTTMVEEARASAGSATGTDALRQMRRDRLATEARESAIEEAVVQAREKLWNELMLVETEHGLVESLVEHDAFTLNRLREMVDSTELEEQEFTDTGMCVVRIVFDTKLLDDLQPEYEVLPEAEVIE